MTTKNTTVGNYAVCNADSSPATSGPVTSGDASRTLHSALRSAITDRVWPWVADLLHPPAVLAEQAPAVDQIRRYAHQGRWTTSTRGPVRAAGVAWCYLVAIPATVIARYAEWALQRPARALVVAVTVKALTAVPAVGWTADHLITPAVHAALRLAL